MCFYLPRVCTINSVSLHSFTSCFQNLYKASVIIDGEGTGAQCPSVRRPRNGVFRRLLGVGPFLPEAPAPGPRSRILSPAPSREHHTPRLYGGTRPASVCRPAAPVTTRPSHAAPRPRSWPRPVPRALAGRLERYKWLRASPGQQ